MLGTEDSIVDSPPRNGTRRSNRNRKNIFKKEDLNLSESDDAEVEDIENDDFFDSKPKNKVHVEVSTKPVGRLEMEPKLATGSIIFQHLSSAGIALKLVLDEWINLWDNNPELSSLQLLNSILWCCNVRSELTVNDLQHPNPAAVLAELQEVWEQAGDDEYPLSYRNKTKLGKTIRKNFPEFWTKLSTRLLANREDAELAKKLIVEWLITMSSSAYRPLRHVSALACFNIVLGCCGLCTKLSVELDQATRVAKTGDMVDIISSQMASIEKLIQMIFDGVFVQRFRDVDPLIRTTSVESLALWIEGYNEVFLDNSYLRYIGWALSDRVSSVRLTSLECFTTIYKNSSLRKGLDSFIQRFLSRILEMASQDKEMAVRNEASKLLSLLYSNAEDETEFKDEYLKWVFVHLRNMQTITKETLQLVLQIVFQSLDENSYKLVASEALKKIKNPRGEDQVNFAVAWPFVLFVSELIEGVPVERHAMIVEHFVANAKRNVPLLRDLTLWLRLSELKTNNTLLLGTKDRSAWESLFFSAEDPSLDEPLYLLLQSVARYSYVFINLHSDFTRQITNGISNCHSKDLANALGSQQSWINQILNSSSILDLIGLADGKELLKSWPCVVDNVISKSPPIESSVSLMNLLFYWHHDEGIDAFETVLNANIKRLEEFSTFSISEFPWDEFVNDGCWSRIAAAFNLLKSHPRIIGIPKLVQFIEAAIQENGDKLLESVVLPSLIRIVVASEDDPLTILHNLTLSPTRLTSSNALLRALVDIRTSLDTRFEEKITDFIVEISECSDLNEELTITSIFDLGRLYLLGCVSDGSIVLVFRLFMGRAEGLVLKCYEALWQSLIVKYQDQIFKLVHLIFCDIAETFGKMPDMKPWINRLFSMFYCDQIKPQLSSSTSLIETFQYAMDNAQHLLDSTLVYFCPLLNSNIATEILSTWMKKQSEEAPLFQKALSKVSSSKKTTNAQKSIRPIGGSRLCEEILSSINDAEEQLPNTPLKEMAGLKMESDATLMTRDSDMSDPVIPSSPSTLRKRTIKM